MIERLARYFSTAPQFWMNLQIQYDLKEFEASEEGRCGLIASGTGGLMQDTRPHDFDPTIFDFAQLPHLTYINVLSLCSAMFNAHVIGRTA